MRECGKLGCYGCSVSDDCPVFDPFDDYDPVEPEFDPWGPCFPDEV